MNMDQHALLLQLTNLAEECGQVMLHADRQELEIKDKAGKANFVTSYDCKIQELIRDRLSVLLPEAGFLGEEDDNASIQEKEYMFIVDPIDGTTNFIRDFHISCVSIGLLKNGKRYMGMIHNPYQQETFTAIAGEGARLNGKPIHVSNEPLENGIVLFGTSPYNTELAKPTFELAFSFFQKCLDVRRCGSAALDLCTVAAGRAEVFFEMILSPWDFAAGALIVEEAGGTVTALDGSELPCFAKTSVIACNRAAQTAVRCFTEVQQNAILSADPDQ